MRLSHLFLVPLVLLLTNSCERPKVVADYNVIPLPQEITLSDKESGFKLNGRTEIYYQAEDKDLERVAGFLSQYLEKALGWELKVKAEDRAEDRANAIVLRVDTSMTTAESYKIVVSAKGATITGADVEGVFYGVQTLRKSVPAEMERGKILEFPSGEVNDYPRFGYRGMHLDVSRHFFTVDEVKTYIDILALHNINIFHWHLTDDQGWRIEIKKYPKLTEIGSQRAQTVIKKNSGEYDGKPYGGYYTQEEIREVIAYAQDRFINVIPEIDLPGHMLAALAAYPELGCTGGPYKAAEMWGIFDEVLCAGNEQIYTFLEDIFAEVIDLFPYRYVHVGGDECPKTNWEKCAKCQEKIKELGLTSDAEHTKEERLQSYVFTRIEKYINDKGRRIIGWDELLEGGIAPNATIMSWRGNEGGIAAAQQGHDVIMTPTSYMYFDYYQSKDVDNEPFGIGGYVPVEKVYSYNPVFAELTAEQQKHILGVQANLWTEYVKDAGHLQYMLLPRLDALSEVQWTMPERKNYDEFLGRLSNMANLYRKLGYNFATHVFEKTEQQDVESK